MRELVIAFLKQSGQTTADDLAAGLSVKDSGELQRILGALVADGSLKLSPRGNYYVPGHLVPSPKPRPVGASGSAVVAFGLNTPTGTGFEADGRLVVPGDVLTNRQLMEIFRVSSMGGIRVSKATGCVLVVSSVDNDLYKDRWNERMFMYTGEGRFGDQTMSRGNLALADARSAGRPLLLFFKRKTNAYEFQGEVRVAGPVASEQQPDETGLVRRVFLFPLTTVEDTEAP